MFQQLAQEKLLVWNGWEHKDIAYTIDIMKLYGKNILFYTQTDQYAFLAKKTNIAVKGASTGYDAQKYSDIVLTSNCSISYLYLLQLIKYDSVLVRTALISLIFTQIGKFVFYIIIEAVNMFYTRGTGLAIIRTPFYVMFEFVLFWDVVYYLNWSDSGRAWTFDKKASYFRQIGVKIVEKTVQGILTMMICLYSTGTPSSSNGTIHSYHYTNIAIVFVLLHILVLEKMFNFYQQNFSIYKAIIILSQIVFIYLCFILISVIDKYHFKAILWNILTAGNLLITIIICIWLCLTIPAIRLLWSLVKDRRFRWDKPRKTA